MKRKKLWQIITNLKAELKQTYKGRFKNLVLFGSWARAEGTDESDIDLLLVLEGPVRPGQEIDRIIDLLTDFNLKYDILLSVIPISEEEYFNNESPLLMNVRKEGVEIEL